MVKNPGLRPVTIHLFAICQFAIVVLPYAGLPSGKHAWGGEADW